MCTSNHYRFCAYTTNVDVSLIVTAFIGLAFCLIPKVNYFATVLVTICHELGHAIVVMPFGGRLRGIKLRLNTEGEAQVSLPVRKPPLSHIVRTINLFAGYGAPLFTALLLFVSVQYQWVPFLSGVFVVASILVTLFIRNWFGVLIVLGFVAVNVLFVFFLSTVLLSYAVFIATVLLIRGGFDIYQIGKWTFRGLMTGDSDFTLAAGEMGGSPKGWYILFVVTQTVFFGFMVWVTTMVLPHWIR